MVSEGGRENLGVLEGKKLKVILKVKYGKNIILLAMKNDQSIRRIAWEKNTRMKLKDRTEKV